jgi:hypothetical protein
MTLLKVTLVEGGDLGKVRAWEMPPNAYSNRVVSLTNASQDFLDGMQCSIITPALLRIHCDCVRDWSVGSH